MTTIYVAVWYDATAVSVYEATDHDEAVEKFRRDAQAHSSAGAKLFAVPGVAKPTDGLPWHGEAIASMGDGEFMDHRCYVHLWGSHPDNDNDDCHTGKDFLIAAAARDAFLDPWSHFDAKYYQRCTSHIELCVDGGSEVRANPDYVETPDDDSDWRREQAMQAGMGMGVDAYNDAMGYDLDNPEE